MNADELSKELALTDPDAPVMTYFFYPEAKTPVRYGVRYVVNGVLYLDDGEEIV